MFDAAAFADTIHQIRRALERTAQTVAWLAPCAYELGAGGKGATICSKCNGKGVLNDGYPCNDCVVATIRDAGEIILRRWHVAENLNNAAKELDRIWDLTKGLEKRAMRLANIIDRGTDHLPGLDDTALADPREVLESVAARNRRIARGEQPSPLADVEKHAATTLTQAIKTEEAIEAARARRAEGKRGNKWRK